MKSTFGFCKYCIFINQRQKGKLIVQQIMHRKITLCITLLLDITKEWVKGLFICYKQPNESAAIVIQCCHKARIAALYVQGVVTPVSMSLFLETHKASTH